ncbi:MAG TPA: IS3 family transposase, partial [Candidatus Dormibacteraeota bacterium]|nr:IS3 family transposase [Candidatus Dormibacteraeota bacterium]
MHRFICAKRANYSVTTLCRVLDVSRAGFYAAQRRPPCERALADRVIAAAIREIHADSRQTYGAPRVQAMLARREIHVGRKRVARLMRQEGISGLIRRKRGPPTVRIPGIATAPDLVRREWNPIEPNRLWVADITYCGSWEGWLYLAAVLDCYSRKVIGWSLREDLGAELVTDAIEMAVARRRPEDRLVHHSDRGGQGEFKWSSQHSIERSCDGQEGSGLGAGGAAGDALAGTAAGWSARASAA